MNATEPSAIRVHEDPDLFREALGFTAAATGFTAHLIEKDYFCSVLLARLAATSLQMVLKGGTCLAKVYAEFYRLSEDMDFAIPMPVSAKKSERSREAAGVKAAIAALPSECPCFRVAAPLRGANNCSQYVGGISYTSLLSQQAETIRIEVSLREPLLAPAVNASARTLLLDPISREPLVTAVQVRCISRTEAFAEKFRAALTRREVAIRDFFDLDYAVRHLGLQPRDALLVETVRRKLAVPGNDPITNVSAGQLRQLHRQLASQLRPVLRQRDYEDFDLNRAFHLVAGMAQEIAKAD